MWGREGHSMKPRIFVLPFCLALAALPTMAADRAPTRFEYEEPHMGTRFRIVLYAADKPTADKAGRAAFARVAELNGIMSDYLPTSELMQLCKRFEKEVGEPVKVSEDLFFVLTRAKAVSEKSEDRKSTRLNSSHLGIS